MGATFAHKRGEGSSSDCLMVLNDPSKYPEYLLSEKFFANAKIHIIKNTRGPVSRPEEAKVGQSAVVHCSPEYEEHFSFENVFFQT